MEWLGVLLALAAGGGAGWLLARARGLAAQEALAQARQDRDRLQSALDERDRRLADQGAQAARLEAALEHERKAAEEKLSLLNEAEKKLREAFEALSSKALKDNRQEFLDLAQSSLLAPIKESLEKVDAQVQAMEKERQQAYGGLTQHLKSLVATQEKLHAEAESLVKALRAPAVRGRWGEIQLRRVLDITGMVPHCDFVEQESVAAEQGRLRPDVVVRLPGGKNVVVDAKAPLQAYLDALEAGGETESRSKLQEHTRLIRDHMARLSSKAYWDQFPAAPDFVVMFLPGESFYRAALEHDFSLIEDGVNQRVILASPTILITLLQAIAYGWRQERIADNAQKISDLGKQLYDRLRTLGGHFTQLGRGLERAVDSYNSAVGSLERSVLPSARRFSELGAVGGDEMPVLEGIDKAVRKIQAPGLMERGEE
jgi:DNA recombination protein RmuC